MITQKQRDILEVIRKFIDEHGYSPSVREICEITGLKSTATVHGYLKRLEEHGLLNKAANKNRAVSPSALPIKPVQQVPMVGTITAGQPILAAEQIEGYYPVPESFARGRELFILEVRGDSMKNAGIQNGDKIIVQKQNTAENGEIVAALIDDSATVKRFYKEKGKFRLQPENDDYQPIILSEVHILGIVIGLFREF